VIHAHGLNAPFAEITFDFILHPESASAPKAEVTRPHAEAA
jgi:catechol 1,2-dioxygenase